MEFTQSGKYHHHFQQTSNSGVEQELLQYYDYICLDIFKEQKPHIAGELERWLNFLTIDQVEEMKKFLAKNSSFQDVYSRVILLTKDREQMKENEEQKKLIRELRKRLEER